jgi:predicted RNA binding protein YcfA (HicA-like mRNA interferase family)
MKVREIIKEIQDDGWYIVAQEGSHRQFKHPKKPGRVTIAGNLGDDVPSGTLGNIYRQAQIKKGRR